MQLPPCYNNPGQRQGLRRPLLGPFLLRLFLLHPLLVGLRLPLLVGLRLPLLVGLRLPLLVGMCRLMPGPVLIRPVLLKDVVDDVAARIAAAVPGTV